MIAPLAPDRAVLLGHRQFSIFWLSRLATTVGYQMLAVGIGWQLYDLTRSPLDLGLVGLIQFVPVVLMSVAIGNVADRYDRVRVACLCQIGKLLAALALAAGSFGGWLSRDMIFAVVLLVGTCRAFETPTLQAFVPGLVPETMLSRAIAGAEIADGLADIGGPAIGGILYLFGPTTVYVACALAFGTAAALIGRITLERASRESGKVTMQAIFAGFSYFRENRALVGAVSLDLCAMLLGGVNALLPIFARDILGTGPWGLGILRSAPAVGELVVSAYFANRALAGRIGLMLLATVGVFGLSIISFGLSRSLILSVLALALYGGSDELSVIIRRSLVQSHAPGHLLGRVMAVNSLSTGTSGTAGDFESGALAALLGAVPAVLIGGAGAILAVVLWSWWCPELLGAEMPGEDRDRPV
jgi:MFS family permease